MEKYNYYLSVGEPWDFVGPDGKNIIKGEVIKKKDDKMWVFRSDHFIDFDYIHGNVFILIPRYSGDDFSNWVDDLVIINGKVLGVAYNGNLSAGEIIDNCKPGIIGSIRRLAI